MTNKLFDLTKEILAATQKPELNLSDDYPDVSSQGQFEAFVYGWLTNADLVNHTADYLIGCCVVDWQEYQRLSRGEYLKDLLESPKE